MLLLRAFILFSDISTTDTMVQLRAQNAPGKVGKAGPSGYTYGKAVPEVDQAPLGVIASPMLLGTVLVWSQQNCRFDNREDFATFYGRKHKLFAAAFAKHGIKKQFRQIDCKF